MAHHPAGAFKQFRREWRLSGFQADGDGGWKDVRIHVAAMILFLILSATAFAGASHRTENFIVDAPDEATAVAVAESAEYWLAVHAREFLGREEFKLTSPCVVSVEYRAENSSGGGATAFAFDGGRLVQPTATWVGPRQKLIEDIVPHEVFHLVINDHFGRAIHRWFDEGVASNCESDRMLESYRKMNIDFLTRGRGIAFNQMLVAKEYPRDSLLPFYAQSASAVGFLLYLQPDKKHLINFGIQATNTSWTGALQKYYGLHSTSEFQVAWLDWVRKGSPRHSRHVAARLELRQLLPWRWGQNQQGSLGWQRFNQQGRSPLLGGT